MDDLRPGRSHAGRRHPRLAAVLRWRGNLRRPVGLGAPCHPDHGEGPDPHHPVKVRRHQGRRVCARVCMWVRACACVWEEKGGYGVAQCREDYSANVIGYSYSLLCSKCNSSVTI